MRVAPVDIAGLAKLILSPECKSIAVLTGAGVSVASGIPDFRSPGGMYDTLCPDLITATPAQRNAMKHEPMAVVTWEMFEQNSFPYMEVRRPFILGTKNHQWKATIAHRFFELLHVKTNKLTRIFTQNIDGLDHQCKKIPTEKIVNVHGSISSASCEGCGTKMDFVKFCEAVETNIKDIYNPESGPKESTPILCGNCKKPLVKPTTVLFGRSLPSQFFERVQEDLPNLDLLIVAGTSLVVSPANSLCYSVPQSTVRVIVNQEPVGEELGIDYSPESTHDFFAQGKCDDVFLELIIALGWLDDLNVKDLPPSSAKLVQENTAN
ncbi:dependent histone deacetylase SIR2 [Seminavis robusta]|uniref:Dependent histone deacetylase SIR2 n=1 Tax=Seminavis robusta TaxID=568900 RepID=A0A9N8E0A6_9STRA|nr:dependent histone deacetylase SIR2 [Seminavis robusta]|eukprot:Sro521_g159500.1 dependent histone deacetylase SIR2 (322) ;mRNA; r:59488-60453